MSASDVLQFYGTHISAEYFNGTDYTDFEFVYSSQETIASVYSSVSYSDSVYEGAPFLLYLADVSSLPNYNTNPSYITVNVMPQYSITNTQFVHTFIGLEDLGSNSTIYQSPSYDWVWSGQNRHFENSATDPSTSGGQACFGLSGSSVSHLWYTFVPVDLTSSSSTSGYSVRASFSGNDVSGSSNTLGLAIGLPYVSVGASGSSGTLPPESSGGSGDVNVTVDVDMSETNEKLDESNGFLSSIVSWITDFFSNLGSFFIRLFVPADGFIDNWKEDLAEAIADTFSPVDTVEDTLDRLKQAFDIAGEGSINAMEFPAISIPGTSFSTPAISVPLRPMTDSSIYDKVAKFIDILATIAVFNMLLTKFKAFLVGEKVVEIEDVD